MLSFVKKYIVGCFFRRETFQNAMRQGDLRICGFFIKVSRPLQHGIHCLCCLFFFFEKKTAVKLSVDVFFKKIRRLRCDEKVASVLVRSFSEFFLVFLFRYQKKTSKNNQREIESCSFFAVDLYFVYKPLDFTHPHTHSTHDGCSNMVSNPF